MRNDLPIKIWLNEAGIINLDDKTSSGTHWVAYLKKHKKIIYFDSFGNLQPPKEAVKYFGSNNDIIYNYNKFQKFNTVNCGHLCLHFLYSKSNIFNK